MYQAHVICRGSLAVPHSDSIAAYAQACKHCVLEISDGSILALLLKEWDETLKKYILLVPLLNAGLVVL